MFSKIFAVRRGRNARQSTRLPCAVVGRTANLARLPCAATWAHGKLTSREARVPPRGPLRNRRQPRMGDELTVVTVCRAPRTTAHGK